MASAPVDFNAFAMSRVFPGVCSTMTAPSFWSSLHFGDVGLRERPVMDLNFEENLESVRRSSVIR